MREEYRPSLESNGSQARFNMAKGAENGQRRKRVLVVGAGAAGKLTNMAETGFTNVLK